MKSQLLLSILCVTSLFSLAVAQQAPAAGLHQPAERALEDGHRRHHARATVTTTQVTLALSRRPLHRSTTTSKTTTTSKSTSTTKPATSSTKSSTTSKAATSTSSSTTSIVAVPSSGTRNLKKGVSYNTINNTIPFGNNVGWAYDWFSDPSDNGLPKGVEFTPMLWSGLDTYLTGIWDKQVQAAIKNGSTHLLGFNEPDLSSQSDMTTDQAVTAWRKYMDPYAGKMKLVAPAITNGGAPSGVAWMTEFLAKCTGCHIDAVAMHWYDAAWNTGYFTNYFTDAIKTFSPRPIWITEFRGSGTAAAQVSFINTVVPWMNKNPGIERYAIFGNYDGPADEGNMITNGQLNVVGKAYRDAA